MLDREINLHCDWFFGRRPGIYIVFCSAIIFNNVVVQQDSLPTADKYRRIHTMHLAKSAAFSVTDSL